MPTSSSTRFTWRAGRAATSRSPSSAWAAHPRIRTAIPVESMNSRSARSTRTLYPSWQAAAIESASRSATARSSSPRGWSSRIPPSTSSLVKAKRDMLGSAGGSPGRTRVIAMESPTVGVDESPPPCRSAPPSRRLRLPDARWSLAPLGLEQEHLDRDVGPGHDLAVVVAHLHARDLLDPGGDLGGQLGLPGQAHAPYGVLAIALDQLLLELEEAAPHDDDEEVVVDVGLRLVASTAEEPRLHRDHRVRRVGELVPRQVHVRDPNLYSVQRKPRGSRPGSIGLLGRPGGGSGSLYSRGAVSFGVSG